MKDFILLVSFIIISACSYLVQDYKFWIIVLLIEVLAIFIVKPIRSKLRRYYGILALASITILVTFFMNFWLSGLNDAIMFSSRFIAMSLFGMSFVILFGLQRLKNALLFICRGKNIKLIIIVTFALVDKMILSFKNFGLALKIKGFKLTPSTFGRYTKVLLSFLSDFIFTTLESLILSLKIKMNVK
jgi:hypothetical protein